MFATIKGRFAPSPTGPLHFGSLVAAVASFVDARAAGGHWLVRIEDVDTPRTVIGAADTILRSLEAHGLHWDGPVMVQSKRSDAYGEALARLGAAIYPCGCSRRDVLGRYPGTCRTGVADARKASALRLRVPHNRPIAFTDRLRGVITEALDQTCGDFVLRRADGIYAYQLAVVVDDAAQGITDVVRGSDLLDSTARQVYLYEALGASPIPRYLHLPIVCDPSGVKLSKQTGAPALDDADASGSLWRALEFLNQSPPLELRRDSPQALLAWAIRNWKWSALAL